MAYRSRAQVRPAVPLPGKKTCGPRSDLSFLGRVKRRKHPTKDFGFNPPPPLPPPRQAAGIGIALVVLAALSAPAAGQPRGAEEPRPPAA